MSAPRAVLFDFGDTLFHRAGDADAIIRAGAALGVCVTADMATGLWASIQTRARTSAEIARGRDLSPEAHRACWLDLYREADVVADGMAELLYGYETDPASWVPFSEAAEVLTTLRSAAIPIGVVSDTGWDIRPVFAMHGFERLVDEFVLSCEMGAAKPTPTVFRAACDRLGVLPSQTVMVGDNPLTDGGAALAGLTCLILPAPASSGHEPLRLVCSLFGVS